MIHLKVHAEIFTPSSRNLFEGNGLEEGESRK
jgi:hypothetical protein